MSLQESLDAPVKGYMSKGFAKVGADESIYHAARVMQESGVTEAIVVQGDAPVGIITERDILYKVVAAGLYPQHVKVRDVMSAPLESIDESSRVADAIAKMSKLGIRRLGVTRGGEVVGMVTQKAVVAGAEGKIVLPELVAPDSFPCPYCGRSTKSKEELSKHIDQVHAGGLGLLQGDVSKW